MGLVYAPQQPVGKGATSGNLKFFNPRLAGSGSRIGTIIAGGVAGYRFVKANYKFFTGLGAVATGAGVENLVGSPNNQFRETYSSVRFRQRGHRFSNNGQFSRGYRRPNKRQRCSCRCCSKGNLRRTMVSRRGYGYRKVHRMY